MSVRNAMEFLSDGSFNPWLEFRKEGNLSIAIIDSRFNCFDGVDNSTDGTLEYFQKLKDDNKIDYLETKIYNLTEPETRTFPLNYLVNEAKVDAVISSAPDEYFTLSQIKDLYQYIQRDPYIGYYKIQYKNYVFDKNSFELSFRPKRVWRVLVGNYKLWQFSGDDDCIYKGLRVGEIVPDISFASKDIPILVKHYTWISGPTSKKKVEYQTKRWAPPNGFGCSYKWNEEKNCLEYNEEYYKLTGQQKPKLHKEP